MTESGPLFRSQRQQVVAFTAGHAIPMLYEWRDDVRDGGLMSYGTDLAEVFRHAGVYAGRVLKGEKPGELPVVQQGRESLCFCATIRSRRTSCANGGTTRYCHGAARYFAS
jgi:putative ABC transport system substrate-binding protein